MGKIVTIVGNLGAGKTTLTQLLCDKGLFVPYLENPQERPFQKEFGKDLPRWALANQMDFLLFRYSQEVEARQKEQIAVMDGGIDQDFHVFTKHLLNQGHLSPGEFSICQRFYTIARRDLPPPELIIRINIDIPTLLQRRLTRDRNTVDRSFAEQEFTDLEMLLDDWLEQEKLSPVLPFVFEKNLQNCTYEINELIIQLKSRLLARGMHNR